MTACNFRLHIIVYITAHNVSRKVNKPVLDIQALNNTTIGGMKMKAGACLWMDCFNFSSEDYVSRKHRFASEPASTLENNGFRRFLTFCHSLCDFDLVLST